MAAVRQAVNSTNLWRLLVKASWRYLSSTSGQALWGRRRLWWCAGDQQLPIGQLSGGSVGTERTDRAQPQGCGPVFRRFGWVASLL